MKTSHLALLSTISLSLPAAPSAASDPAPPIDVGAVLGAAAMKGPHHQVDPEATCDGLLGNYRIRTHWGVVQARGREMAEVRIAEVPGLERAQAVSSTDAFAGAAKTAAMKPVKLVTNLAEDPGGTAEGTAKSVGRLFKGAARSVESGVQGVSDSRARKKEEKAGENGGSDSSSSTATKVKDVANEVAGMNKARRSWAKKLGVDPYTRNPLIEDKLEGLAKASFLGGLATTIVVPSIPGVSMAVTVNDLAYSMSASDLQVRNEQKLKAMGIEGRPARDYFRNPWFTPTIDVELVDALEALKGVRGREEILKRATSVGSEEEARFVRNSVRMLAAIHAGKAPLDEARATADVVYGRRKDGTVLVPAPLDYLSWSDIVREALSDPALKGKSRHVLVTGPVSEPAAKALATAGWTSHERVSWSSVARPASPKKP